MVKKLLASSGILLAAFWFGLGGCSKSSAPVSPRAGGPAVSLNVASIQQAVKAAAEFTEPFVTTVKYRLEGPGGVVKRGSFEIGTEEFYMTPPPVLIALPVSGKYLVSVECFARDNITATGYYYLNDGATLLGAQEVNVDGLTPVRMRMGRLDSACYSGYTEVEYYLTFDTNNRDTVSGDLFFPETSSYENTLVSTATEESVVYLGNGDLVDFPRISKETTFYWDTFTAKGEKPIAIGDIFGIKIPDRNALVWLQITEVGTGGGGALIVASKRAKDYGDYIGFRFRYNDDGKDHYAFDMTSSGQMNCNDALYPDPAQNLVQRAVGYTSPVRLDLDGSGRLYVADQGVPAVLTLDATGNTVNIGLGSFSNLVDVAVSKGSPTTVYALDQNAYQVKTFSSQGVSLGYFNLSHRAVGIGVDNVGQVFVSYNDSTMFQGVGKFDYLGAPIREVGAVMYGSGPGEFHEVQGVAADSSGRVYVADGYNNRVQVFDNDLNYLREVRQIASPSDVAVDAAGNLYVASFGNVYKFDPLGNALSSLSTWIVGVDYHYFYSVYGLAAGDGHLYTVCNDDLGMAVNTFNF